MKPDGNQVESAYGLHSVKLGRVIRRYTTLLHLTASEGAYVLKLHPDSEGDLRRLQARNLLVSRVSDDYRHFQLAQPIPNTQGEYVQAFGENQYGILMPAIDGSVPSHVDGLVSYTLGSVIGALHNANRTVFEDLVGELRLVARLETEQCLSMWQELLGCHDGIDHVGDMCRRTACTIDATASSSPSFGLCHGDVWHGNLLLGPSPPVLLDYDDMCYAHREMDFASFAWWLVASGHPAVGECWRGFLKGYRNGGGDRLLDDKLFSAYFCLRELRMSASLVRSNALALDELKALIRLGSERLLRLEISCFLPIGDRP